MARTFSAPVKMHHDRVVSVRRRVGGTHEKEVSFILCRTDTTVRKQEQLTLQILLNFEQKLFDRPAVQPISRRNSATEAACPQLLDKKLYYLRV